MCVCVCVCVCVRGLRWGLLWELHPSILPLPSKRLYKGGGGKGTFVTLLSDTETTPLSLDTQTLWAHTFLGDLLIILRKEVLHPAVALLD